jgi:hypothetical protein
MVVGLWWKFTIYGGGGREVVIGVACIVEGGVRTCLH